MPRKKKEVLEEEVLEETFELEEQVEEVSEETPEEVLEEVKEVYQPTPEKHEYRVTFFIFGNNAVLVRKEEGRSISKTIPRTSGMKIGDIISL